MKILIITTPKELGGGETYVRDLIKGLPQHEFLVLSSLKEFNARLSAQGIRVRCLKTNIKFLSRLHIILFLILAPFNILQYLFYLISFNPRIIHIQSKEEQILVTPIARLLGKKVIWTIHGPLNRGNRVVDFLYLKSSLCVNQIIAVSYFVEDSIKKFGIKFGVAVIYHGVDLNRFKPVADSDKKIIGYVGRLIKIKRPETFLEASIKVLQKIDRAEVWILGKGDLKEKMKKRVSETGMSRRVKFLGFREDIENIIRQFTVLVITSQTEGLNISALEALACGVPVVSVNTAALPEIVNHQTGVLVDSIEPEAIAKKVISIMNYPDLMELKRSCRRVAEGKFSQEVMLEKTNSIYETI